MFFGKPGCHCAFEILPKESSKKTDQSTLNRKSDYLMVIRYKVTHKKGVLFSPKAHTYPLDLRNPDEIFKKFDGQRPSGWRKCRIKQIC